MQGQRVRKTRSKEIQLPEISFGKILQEATDNKKLLSIYTLALSGVMYYTGGKLENCSNLQLKQMIYLKEEEFCEHITNSLQQGIYTYSLIGYKKLLQAQYGDEEGDKYQRFLQSRIIQLGGNITKYHLPRSQVVLIKDLTQDDFAINQQIQTILQKKFTFSLRSITLNRLQNLLWEMLGHRCQDLNSLKKELYRQAKVGQELNEKAILKAIHEYILMFQDYLCEDFFYLLPLSNFELQLKYLMETVEASYNDYYKKNMI